MKKLLFIVLGIALGFAAQSQVVISLEDGSVSPKLASTAPTRDVEVVSDGLLVLCRIVVKY